MLLKYLRPSELERLLLAVPTTLDEAKGVIARNRETLRRLRSYKPCPHCRRNPMYRCTSCAWNTSGRYAICPCTKYEFAGRDMHRVAVEADANWLSIEAEGLYPDKNSRPFLQAHVEWGRVLVALGGTAQISWRKMTAAQKLAWRPPVFDNVVKKLKLTWKLE